MKKRKPLSPELKKLVWSEPESNAGAGWRSYNENTRSDFPPIRPPEPDLPLDRMT